MFSCSTEGNVANLASYCCCFKQTIGIEDTNEATGYQVKNLFLHLGQTCCRLSCGDDGMVVRHLAVIKELLLLSQFLSLDPVHQVEIILQSVHYLTALWIYVIWQVCGIYTRVGRNLLLIQALDKLQGLVGRESELLVALYLQAGKVKQAWWCLLALFLLNILYGEGQVLYFLQYCLALFSGLKSLGSLFLVF